MHINVSTENLFSVFFSATRRIHKKKKKKNWTVCIYIAIHKTRIVVDVIEKNNINIISIDLQLLFERMETGIIKKKKKKKGIQVQIFRVHDSGVADYKRLENRTIVWK